MSNKNKVLCECRSCLTRHFFTPRELSHRCRPRCPACGSQVSDVISMQGGRKIQTMQTAARKWDEQGRITY